MDTKKSCYITFANVALVVFIFGGLCVLMSLQILVYEEISLRVRVLSWILFAFSVCAFLPGLVGLLNLKVLEKYLEV